MVADVSFLSVFSHAVFICSHSQQEYIYIFVQLLDGARSSAVSASLSASGGDGAAAYYEALESGFEERSLAAQIKVSSNTAHHMSVCLSV